MAGDWAPGRRWPGRGYREGVTERRWTERLLPARDSGEPEKYPGEKFGLPEHGPRSVAGMGRRLLALLIDWLASTAVALAIFQSAGWTLVVFSVEVYLLTALTGFTVGKRVLGMRVARLDGRPVGFWWALVRTILLIAVIPPLVTDRDLRGLHDRAANTIVLRS